MHGSEESNLMLNGPFSYHSTGSIFHSAASTGHNLIQLLLLPLWQATSGKEKKKIGLGQKKQPPALCSNSDYWENTILALTSHSAVISFKGFHVLDIEEE